MVLFCSEKEIVGIKEGIWIIQNYNCVSQKDILSDECDKDSGYEPDQVNFWPRNPLSNGKRAGFRNKKQRSLDVHDVRKGLHRRNLFYFHATNVAILQSL